MELLIIIASIVLLASIVGVIYPFRPFGTRRNALIAFIASFILTGVISPFSEGDDKTAATAATSEIAQPNYSIAVSATPISAHVVSLEIETNIPLPVEVMASVSAKGQAPTDTYIGVSKRVKLTSDQQIINLDGSSEGLPSGDYLAEVTFYPRWGADIGTDQAKAIIEEIAGVADVSLSGSGTTMEQAEQRHVAQNWVIENVVVNTPWREGLFVEQLGSFEKSPSTLNLHDAYYFPNADMTIIVSQLKETVAIWRMGRAAR